jgi:hypothetical protein
MVPSIVVDQYPVNCFTLGLTYSILSPNRGAIKLKNDPGKSDPQANLGGLHRREISSILAVPRGYLITLSAFISVHCGIVAELLRRLEIGDELELRRATTPGEARIQ